MATSCIHLTTRDPFHTYRVFTWGEDRKIKTSKTENNLKWNENSILVATELKKKPARLETFKVYHDIVRMLALEEDPPFHLGVK